MSIETGSWADESLSSNKKGTTATVLFYKAVFELSDEQLQGIRNNFSGNEKLMIQMFDALKGHGVDSDKTKNILSHVFVEDEIVRQMITSFKQGNIAVEQLVTGIHMQVFTALK